MATTELSPTAVAIWRRLQRCRDADEERNLVEALDIELNLPPWVEFPWEAVGPCPYPKYTAGAIFWPYSRALRRALSEYDAP